MFREYNFGIAAVTTTTTTTTTITLLPPLLYYQHYSTTTIILPPLLLYNYYYSTIYYCYHRRYYSPTSSKAPYPLHVLGHLDGGSRRTSPRNTKYKNASSYSCPSTFPRTPPARRVVEASMDGKKDVDFFFKPNSGLAWAGYTALLRRPQSRFWPESTEY